jgi:rubredoxin
MIREAIVFLFQGRVCPRCRVERTGHWGRYVTGVPFDEWTCPTCHAVEWIRFRKAVSESVDRRLQEWWKR